MSKPTLKVFSALLIVAAFVTSSVSSCKAPPDCWAYQGSKKSSRSVTAKRTHRHASVISIKNFKAL